MKGLVFCRALLLTTIIVLPDSAVSAERLTRTNLLVFRTASGKPGLVKSKLDWKRRKAEILEAMQTIMGPLPKENKPWPLAMEVESESDCGTYRYQFIHYSSEPRSRVPAFLLIPKHEAKTRLPAVLALHSTDMEHGHRVLVEPLRNHYRTYAVELAERGFVVLAPAYPLMANYQPDLKALGYSSGTMKAIWDNIRGLDLLESLSFVDRKKFGALGHSLGGHNAIYTAVFDERIQVIVSSCGFDSYVDYMDGKIKGWTSERYMPRLLQYQDRLGEIPFDFYELIGALAPRRVFVNAPLHDSNFKWQSVDRIATAARPVFQLHGLPGNLEIEHPDCGHDFPVEIREKAYRVLEEVLR